MDTGADKSLISECVFTTLKSKFVVEKCAPKVELKGVTGHSLKISHSTTLRFRIGQKILKHEFHVVSGLKHEFLLGIDFLQHQKALLDFEHRTLVLGKQVTVLREDTKRSAILVAKTSHKGYLEPRSVTLVKIRLNKPLKRNCLVSPLETSSLFHDQPGVKAPRVVLKNSKHLVIPVFNETHARFPLDKGLSIALVEEVTKDTLDKITQKHLNQQIAESKDENSYHEGLSNTTRTKSADVNNITSVHGLESNAIPQIKAELNQTTRSQLNEFLDKHHAIFAQTDLDLGKTHLTEVNLNTGDSAPIKSRPYRLPFSQRPVLEKHLDDLLKAKIIKRSCSPWSFPILLVPRKDGGSPRMCVDYRRLNKVLVQNSYPLPNINDILSSMQGAQYFSCLDLKSGYYQLPLHKDSQAKTAFVCHKGLFEFNVLPFGLSSAPPDFQNLMNSVIGDAINDFAIVYLDDIIIYSKTAEEHLKHLETIFSRLEQAGLKLKRSKCKFFETRVSYLGHVISGQGIEPDPDKISAIQQLSPPTTVKEVRSLVGMASYYRLFIEGFSDIIRPLTELTRKHCQFQWTPELQRAFEQIKQRLSSAPVLAHPDFTKPFRLYTDASNYAVGAVLAQEQDGGERVVQYVSRQLNKGQQKWPVIEREAYAIIFAMNKLRHYLLGNKVEIRTDHKPLTSLLTSAVQNARVQRWAVMLEEFGCDNISYTPGRVNAPADLSHYT